MVQELAAAFPVASAKLLSQLQCRPTLLSLLQEILASTEMEATMAHAAATAFSGQWCAVLKTSKKLLLSH